MSSRADSPEHRRRQPPSPFSVASQPPPLAASRRGRLYFFRPRRVVCAWMSCYRASGRQAPRPFPTCPRHRLHLECLAQLRVQASRSSDLLWPLCRHGRCPACEPEGWMPRHAAAFRDACEREGVRMPSRLYGEETVPEAVQDYALRTFTSHDAPEPRPPPGVAVLCCNRVTAVRRPGRRRPLAGSRNAMGASTGPARCWHCKLGASVGVPCLRPGRAPP